MCIFIYIYVQCKHNTHMPNHTRHLVFTNYISYMRLFLNLIALKLLCSVCVFLYIGELYRHTHSHTHTCDMFVFLVVVYVVWCWKQKVIGVSDECVTTSKSNTHDAYNSGEIELAALYRVETRYISLEVLNGGACARCLLIR